VCRGQRRANYTSFAGPGYSARTMNTRTPAKHLSRCLVMAVVVTVSHVRAQAPTDTAAEALHVLSADASGAEVKRFVAQHTDAVGRRCALHASASSGTLRYLACGAAGLWVCRVFPDGTGNLLAANDVGGSANGFFVQDGRLWLEITSVRAQLMEPVNTTNTLSPALAAAQPAAAPPTTTPPTATPTATPPSAAPAATTAAATVAPNTNKPTRAPITNEPVGPGRVLRAERSMLIIDMQSSQRREGEHVALYAPSGAADAVASGEAPRPLAIGKVVSAYGEHARVELGMNELVPVGSEAELTQQDLTASMFAPPRVPGVWDVAFLARPFIVLDNLGFGAFADARVGYHMQAPIHVEAMLSPFAFATAKGGAAVPFAALVTAALDTHLFEVGLGLGGQSVSSPDISVDPGSGTTLAQRLRLGARDGAHLEAMSYVSLFHSRFGFSALRVQGQVPVGGRAWLLAAGSGGNLGLGHGELGLRVLVSGNGGPDSFFLTAVIGGVNVFKSCVFTNSGQCNSVNYVGPMVGAGGEWRL
jgi:hypothetical protein